MVQSNHAELVLKKSLYLAISVRMQFEKVRGGLMCLKLIQLVQRAPCTPSIPCKDAVREGSVKSNNAELM